MQTLPGFRDFFPDDFALRDTLFARWRATARGFGYREMDGPMLESIDLYRKKSGDELTTQLFDFTDQGKRHIALRPELTPTVARMLISKAREFKKPIRWFSLGSFFRFERPQSGRLREFAQLNVDLIGEPGTGGEGEILELLAQLLAASGLLPEQVVIRVSHRGAWAEFAQQHQLDAGQLEVLLQVIDKMERIKPEQLSEQLQPLGLSLATIENFIQQGTQDLAIFSELQKQIEQRQIQSWVKLDLSIVRGLAYYTGCVFEVFPRQEHSRALAGGGRYDGLLSKLSDGKVDLPAIGFALGDVPILKYLSGQAKAWATLEQDAMDQHRPHLYLTEATPSARLQQLAQALRQTGYRVETSLVAGRVDKQFAVAEAHGARFALVISEEEDSIEIRELATRTSHRVSSDQVIAHLQKALPLP
ncbi:MAG: histidine--tRNA ligase [Verrucomicrobiales bacterium]